MAGGGSGADAGVGVGRGGSVGAGAGAEVGAEREDRFRKSGPLGSRASLVSVSSSVLVVAWASC